MQKLIIVFCFLVGQTVFVQSSSAKSYNGFDMTNLTLPQEEVISGGPGKDGIPSLNQPAFKPVAEVDYLFDKDQVISIVRGGQAKAYPTRILVWHEVVNDIVAGTPLAITYCPLCGTGMVFDRRVANQTLSFGVSGLLYQSNLLMYDHQSESLWSQLGMEAVSGDYAGQPLRWVTSDQLTWKRWREQYPHGLVLSNEGSYRRQYQRKAYKDYFQSPRPMFRVPRTRKELRQKAWVVGVVFNGVAKAYALKELKKHETVNDQIAGKNLTVKYDAKTRFVAISDSTGRSVPVVNVFWFAWSGFYPETLLWEP